METIFFLIFVGVCAILVVWAIRRPGGKSELGARRKKRLGKTEADKLTVPFDNRLSHREAIWEQRREQASQDFMAKQSFIPKSAGTTPEYDGYSRRDRHHVTPTGNVKEEAHITDAAHT